MKKCWWYWIFLIGGTLILGGTGWYDIFYENVSVVLDIFGRWYFWYLVVLLLGSTDWYWYWLVWHFWWQCVGGTGLGGETMTAVSWQKIHHQETTKQYLIQKIHHTIFNTKNTIFNTEDTSNNKAIFMPYTLSIIFRSLGLLDFVWYLCIYLCLYLYFYLYLCHIHLAFLGLQARGLYAVALLMFCLRYFNPAASCEQESSPGKIEYI